MNPHTNIESAREAINSYNGAPKEFLLSISDELNDPMGMNMAILTDVALSKGWEPDGFDQEKGYRVYRYKMLA